MFDKVDILNIMHFLSKMAYLQNFAKYSKIDSSKNNRSICTQNVSKEVWAYEFEDFIRVFLKFSQYSAWTWWWSELDSFFGG